MTNPWLKKNPFMSMWLSGAHSVANSARGQIAAEARRQSTAAINTAAQRRVRGLGRCDDRRLGREAEEETLGE